MCLLLSSYSLSEDNFSLSWLKELQSKVVSKYGIRFSCEKRSFYCSPGFSKFHWANYRGASRYILQL